MPRIERHADVVWDGTNTRGSGRIDSGTGAFSGLEYSLPVRVGKGAEGKTSPEELLAAAHAGCFAMSLAGELGVESQLRVRVRANVEESAFRNAVDAADEGCPFSQLIKAGAKVSIDAELEGRA